MKRKSRVALALSAVVVACLAGPMSARAARRVSDGAPVPVKASVAKRQDVPAAIEALGTVEPVQTISIQSRVSGQITKILFTPGQEVKKGQPLFQIDPRPYQAALEKAEGQLFKDQALLAQAQADLTRYRRLTRENSISRQQVQDQTFLVRQDEGTVKVDEASVATAKLNLGYARIGAPAAGLTGPLLVDPGNYVAAGTGATLVTITQIAPIHVNFSIPETALGEVHLHQSRAPLAVEATSQAGKKLAAGRLSLIDNEANTSTGTVMLQATFANANHALWPGAFVNVKLVVYMRKNVITVPDQAVMPGPKGPYVYVIRPDDTVLRVNVKVVARQDGIDVIRRGVSAGQLIVTDGQYRLANGVKVAVEPAAKPVTGTASAASGIGAAGTHS